MKTRRLGCRVLKASSLGLGCLEMTWAYVGGRAEGEIATILRAKVSCHTMPPRIV